MKMNFEWSAKITKTSNGYFIRLRGAEPEHAECVVQERDDVDEKLAELKAFQEVHYLLRDHFAITNSKHDTHRMYLEIEEQKE
jgi:hypothetical protein